MAKETSDISESISLLCRRIEALIIARAHEDPNGRVLVALAGVPGSGKSTISSAILQAWPRYGIDSIAVLPMDGFHYTKAELSKFGDPVTAIRRRGAPFTFDSHRFLDLVLRLRDLPVTSKSEPEEIILAPSFDHAEKDPIEDSVVISSRTRVIIIEGNYTLLDEDPWRQVSAVVDDRWYVDVSPATALDRLIGRHLQAGIETTAEAAATRALENDIPNGEMIRKLLIEPKIRIMN